MTEWQAFYAREPWGQKRGEDLGWFQFSELMALIANVNRDSKKKSSPYEGKDFRPADDETEGDTDEEIAHIAQRERMRQVAEEIRDRFMARRQPIVLTDA